MGRLKPGVSLEQAQTRLAPAFHNYVKGIATTAAQLVASEETQDHVPRIIDGRAQPLTTNLARNPPRHDVPC